MTMNPPIKVFERRRNAAAISVRENEGGAPGKDSMHHHYGRRIEADRSWTIYHVFTGIPARFGGYVRSGLSRLDGTSGMLGLILRNAECRRQRVELAPFREVTGPVECTS